MISGLAQTLQGGPKANAPDSISVIERPPRQYPLPCQTQRRPSRRSHHTFGTLAVRNLHFVGDRFLIESHQSETSRSTRHATVRDRPASDTAVATRSQTQICTPHRRRQRWSREVIVDHANMLVPCMSAPTTGPPQSSPASLAPTHTTSLPVPTTLPTCVSASHPSDRDPTRLPAAVRRIRTDRIDVVGAPPSHLECAQRCLPTREPSDDDYRFGSPWRRPDPLAAGDRTPNQSSNQIATRVAPTLLGSNSRWAVAPSGARRFWVEFSTQIVWDNII